MTSIQSVALFLYAAGAVLAIAGPAIAARRLWSKYQEAKKYGGTFGDFDAVMQPEARRASALRDAVWGVVEFGFVALGVVAGSIASIILVVPPSM